VGREGIEMTGLILPASDGRLYVTPDLYESAKECAERLALKRVPSGYFEIPNERLKDIF
jgi:hypothetical protein